MVENFSFANSRTKGGPKCRWPETKIDYKMDKNEILLSSLYSGFENKYLLMVVSKGKVFHFKFKIDVNIPKGTFVCGTFFEKFNDQCKYELVPDYTHTNKSKKIYVDNIPTARFLKEIKRLGYFSGGMEVGGVKIVKPDTSDFSFKFDEEIKFIVDSPKKMFSNFKVYKNISHFLRFLSLQAQKEDPKIFKNVKIINCIGEDFSGRRFVIKTLAKKYDYKIEWATDAENIKNNKTHNIKRAFMFYTFGKEEFRANIKLFCSVINKTGKNDIVFLFSREKVDHFVETDMTFYFKRPSVEEIGDIIKFKTKELEINIDEEVVSCLSLKYFGLSVHSVIRETESYILNEQLIGRKFNTEIDDIEKLFSELKITKKENFIENRIFFKNIGGYDSVKRELTRNIITKIKNRDAIKKMGMVSSNGILLHGPPGCGKTVFAEAIANEAGVNIVKVPMESILDCHFGTTQKDIKRYFDQAIECAPSVLFLDEIDSLGNKREDRSGSNFMKNILNSLLVQINNLKGKDVFLIAATNLKENLDLALIRSGRLGKHIHIPLPNLEEREEIFKTYLKEEHLDYKKFAEKLGEFSGADIECICDEARMLCLEESFEKLEDEDVLEIISNFLETRSD